MKEKINNPVLVSWLALNEFIRSAGEKQCTKLIDEELAGRSRKQFLRRIHSRLNKVRADRERIQLEQK